MKVVILAGGLGTRLAEETDIMPKPMVEIGGRPILWHILKIYSYFGHNDFIILTGYKSHIIKDYFLNYYTRYSDITIDMTKNAVEVHNYRNEPWKITMLYTGEKTMTGGRILRAKDFLDTKPFLLTYGDGVSDVNINQLIEAHKQSGKMLTLTSVKPSGRYGALIIDKDSNVTSFAEKPTGDGAWVNGGFFVCNPQIFDYIENSDTTIFEKDPMGKLAQQNQLYAYKHDGFWKAMDTLKDKNELSSLWNAGSNSAPWAHWRQDAE